MLADENKGKRKFLFSPDESEMLFENLLNMEFKAGELIGNNSYNSFFAHEHIFTYLQTNKS
jgi:hypothetical protein